MRTVAAAAAGLIKLGPSHIGGRGLQMRRADSAARSDSVRRPPSAVVRGGLFQ
jgi:hypothetical protein